VSSSHAPSAAAAAHDGARIALITGASGGIGSALATALAHSGYGVVLVARGREGLARVAATITAAGGAALVLPGDATDAVAMQRVVAAAVAWRGRLDVVVANAGVYSRGLATDLHRDDVEAALRANFWSAFHVVGPALPALRASRGQLVFVNSFDAKKGLPMDAAYATAKAALAGYTGTLRPALRPDGVNVLSVFPGRVDTPMLANLEVPAISAKVAPQRVARAVVRALRARRAEVIVPWPIRSLWWLDVLSPRLADWLVRKLRLDGQSGQTGRSR
jgi:uncharacterized protein